MRTQRRTADILIESCGSMVMVTPMTAAGREWIDENVQSQSWQWMGLSLAVEFSYADAPAKGGAGRRLDRSLTQQGSDTMKPIGNAIMHLRERKRDRLVEILRNTATSCDDALHGKRSLSEDGLYALRAAAEEGLEILGELIPEYEREGAENS